MISREMLEEMFANMRAQAKWNVDGPLLWGYFFTACDKDKLEVVAKVLAAAGYSVVGIWQADDAGSDDPNLWWLHVERVEQHSVDSLHARNREFYGVADRYGLQSYDGMDVGRVES